MYLPLLRQAWQAALGARRRWGYALIAVLVIGGGIDTAVFQTLATDPNAAAFGGILPDAGTLARAQALWAQAQVTGVGAQVALVAFAAFLLALLLAIIAFAVIGVNALVHAAGHLHRGEPIPRRLFRRAVERFWPTLTIHIGGNFATAAILTGWSAILLHAMVTPTSAATVRSVIGFVVTVVLLTIIHLATPYAIAAVVLDGRSATTAVREALALLRDRWLVTVEWSVLLSLATTSAFVAWLAGSILFAFPFILLGGIGVSLGASWLVVVAIAAGLIALVAFTVLLDVVMATFLATAWTLWYLRLTSPGEEPVARIQRTFGR